MGIEHCLLPEQGLVLPGDLVIGADSHLYLWSPWSFSTGVEALHGCCHGYTEAKYKYLNN